MWATRRKLARSLAKKLCLFLEKLRQSTSDIKQSRPGLTISKKISGNVQIYRIAKADEMQKKHKRMILGGAVGLCAAASEGIWPNHVTALQMAFYSIMSLGVAVMGVWSDRRRPRYLTAICTAILIHTVILFLLRTVFPFKTVLTVVPIALLEAVILYAIMLKILGEEVAEC